MKKRHPASVGVALVFVFSQASCSGATPANYAPQTSSASTPAHAEAATLGCRAAAQLTPALTEGPFFKANSPERGSLLQPGLAGAKLLLAGEVLGTDCQPIANALLDFWQADATGQYDNSGYTLRGHQFSDSAGHYELTTIVPGLYMGRTEHIHVKVQAPGRPTLTTQLFFPGVAANEADAIFDQRLLVAVQESAGLVQANFDFVVSER